MRFQNKEVPCPAVPENKPKCLVYLLDLYLAKLPLFALEKNILYLRPKRNTPSVPEAPWYDNVPVGKNCLRTMVKDMCAEVEIYGKTNHSLRASGATALFQNNVPERVIQKVTGHRSLDALRTYEKISTEQHRDVSKVIMTNLQSCNKSVDQPGSSDCGQISGGFMGGINGCSIGSITVNFASEDSYKQNKFVTD